MFSGDTAVPVGLYDLIEGIPSLNHPEQWQGVSITNHTPRLARRLQFLRGFSRNQVACTVRYDDISAGRHGLLNAIKVIDLLNTISSVLLPCLDQQLVTLSVDCKHHVHSDVGTWKSAQLDTITFVTTLTERLDSAAGGLLKSHRLPCSVGGAIRANDHFGFVLLGGLPDALSVAPMDLQCQILINSNDDVASTQV